MKQSISVGVYLPFALAFGRSILEGVQRYAESKPGWRLVVGDAVDEPPNINSITCMIGSVTTGEWAAFARSCRAAINVSNQTLNCDIPRVVSDDVAIGRLAALHLMQRGSKRFVFLRPIRVSRFAIQREAGYLSALNEAGIEAKVCDHGNDICRQLSRIPKPFAVFAATDTQARLLIRKLIDRGGRIPEEIAVLGVDNDIFESQISPVPISSIAPDGMRIGFEAASLLDRILAKRKAPPRVVCVPPLYVVTRKSTNHYTASHPAVSRALQLLQKEAASLVSVSEIAQAAGVGRRTLERLFKAEFGSSVYQELCRAKLDSVMPEILRGSAPMFELAALSGFTDARLFNNVCRRIHGKTPGQLRRES